MKRALKFAVWASAFALAGLGTDLKIYGAEMKNDTEKQLLDAAKAGRAAEVEKLLEGQPTLLKARAENGVSAISLAVYYRHPEIAEIFIQKGARLDLYESCATGKVKTARELLEKEPGLAKSYSPDGHTPLGLASFFGHMDLARLLLASGADVNAPSKNEMRVRPLHSATAGHHMEIVQALLSAGADANARQEGGFVPLHEAASEGDWETAKLLVRHGARIDIQAENGKSASDLARDRGHKDLAEWLEARDAAKK